MNIHQNMTTTDQQQQQNLPRCKDLDCRIQLDSSKLHHRTMHFSGNAHFDSTTIDHEDRNGTKTFFSSAFSLPDLKAFGPAQNRHGAAGTHVGRRCRRGDCLC